MVQLRVEREKQTNLEKTVHFVANAAHGGAEMVVLPEMFVCPYESDVFPWYAESFTSGPTLRLLAHLAREHHLYLVGGSLPEKTPHALYNSCPVFDPQGELVAVHRKIHLFDVCLPTMRFEESLVFSPGSSFTLFDTPWGRVGAMICYDVRFPELARLYALHGATIIVAPAAFNHVTGPLHWELTFRARALDNQVFMVGVSPAPHPHSQYRAYGHSMVTNPWGQIVQEMGEEEGVTVVELHLEEIRRVRENLPLLKHRRNDLYAIFRRQDFPLYPSCDTLIDELEKE